MNECMIGVFFAGAACGLWVGRMLYALTEESRQRERCMRCEDMQKRRHSNGDADENYW